MKLSRKWEIEQLELSNYCLLGKQHWVKFRSDIHNSRKMFEYVRSNLWALSKVETHGERKVFYLLIIINNFSKRVWVHILKNKRGTFKKFKELHTLIARKSNAILQLTRSTNIHPHEYTSRQLWQFGVKNR